jgi:hypothetical protein
MSRQLWDIATDAKAAQFDQAQAQNEQRQRRLARVRSAAQKLRDDKDWNAVWLHLQGKFPLADPVFATGHESNTHLAAKKDGNREVIAEILKLMSLPLEADFEDGNVELKPAAAVSEIGATTKNP